MLVPFARSALSFVILIGAGVVSCIGGGEGDDSIPLPELTDFDIDLAERLDEIAANAADVRELEPNESFEQGTLTREQLTDHYDDVEADLRLDEEINFDALNSAFVMLGMIGPDDDLLEIVTSFYAFDVLGFYSYEDAKLVLVTNGSDDLSPADELVMAHEYVHSLQDGAFDLSELLKLADDEAEDKANTEYVDTLRALIEGDADLAEGQYLLSHFSEQQFAELIASPASVPDGGPSIPAAFERYFSFPYTYGVTFVQALFAEDGWDAVDDAYADPPRTEEQILHPDKYLAGEGAIALALPDIADELGGGWVQEADDVFGEFDVYNWLFSVLDDELAAFVGAEGWGGGRLVIYGNEKESDRVLIQLALMWDDKTEALEFQGVFANVIADASPETLDPSGQIVAWETDDTVGQAWAQRTAFRMVIATDAGDLDSALMALDAPTEIADSDLIIR